MHKIDVSLGYYYDQYSKGHTPKLTAEQFEVSLARAREVLASMVGKDYQGGFDDEVRACLCAMAESIFETETQKGKKSENIDGYSVVYDGKSVRAKLFDVAAIYLGSSGLLYAGVE